MSCRRRVVTSAQMITSGFDPFGREKIGCGSSGMSVLPA